MRLSERFLKIIDGIVPPGVLSPRKAALLQALDPGRFYVENVRSILGVPRWVAVRICESGVRQHVFACGIEVRCPNGSVGASADTEDDLPSTVECTFEEDGHLELEEIPTAQLEKVRFYSLSGE